MSRIASRKGRGVFAVVVLMLVVSILGTACAPGGEAWPTKQVTLVNPFGAGGAADVQARKYAEIMSKTLGQPMVVKNTTGAGGAPAYNEVQQATADGYTLIWYSGAINTLAATKQIPFNYTAFEPVCGIGAETVALAVKKDAPWKDFKEFIAYAKANPGKVTIGNSGSGSVTHMVPVAMAAWPRLSSPTFPSAPAWQWPRCSATRSSASSQHPAEILAQVKSGDVRILAVSSEKRIALWPDVPTMKESGVDTVYEQWRGVAAPKGTPKVAIDKLAASARPRSRARTWTDFAASVGSSPQYRDPAATATFVASMDKLTIDIMTAAGLAK